jgi:glyoxylase-like metal-dependent hydrolase (beta-lactamase superfamily II)
MSSRSSVVYTITAIRVGTLTTDRGNLLYGEERGREFLDVPVWCGVVSGGEKHILVDTGIRDPSWVAANGLGACHQGESDTMVGALDRVGLRCADIDIVVNTHLHFDHCANNYLFPEAEFFVAKPEWDAALHPIEEQAILYSAKEWLLKPLEANSYTLIDEDDVEIAPGVWIMQTPGHSQGHQVVLVDTAEGAVCIAGDSVNCNENFILKRPPGIVWDLGLATASLEKIRGRANRILMAHDVRVGDFMTSGFPVIPGADARVGR